MELMGCRSTVEPVCIRIIVHRHAVLRDHLRALRAAMTFEAAARKRTQRNGDRGKTNNRDAWHDLPHSSELAPSLHPAPRKRGEGGDFPHPRRIEPDMKISRIRLSDKTSRLHPRHVVPIRGGFETRSYETRFCGMWNEVVERRI